MTGHSVNLEYPHDEFPLILQHSYHEEEFFGVSIYESKKLKIILSKYGCQHCFHTLPSHITMDLHPFVRDKRNNAFRIHPREIITVQLNQLEEAVINYNYLEQYY